MSGSEENNTGLGNDEERESFAYIVSPYSSLCNGRDESVVITSQEMEDWMQRRRFIIHNAIIQYDPQLPKRKSS